MMRPQDIQMNSPEFEARVLPLIEEDLKKMPCLWWTERDADNAWDMLVGMWPDNEPGLGLWDQIEDLIQAWISGLLETQPLDDLRQYWEENADHDEGYYENRQEVEELGAAPWFPPLEVLCDEIARKLWSHVLSRVECEGDRRFWE